MKITGVSKGFRPSDAKEGDAISPKSFPYLRRSRISLEQWRALHAVVACGSYAEAANLLNVTQPAVSYAIAKLEAQLGISLHTIEGRRARLTVAGMTLIERSYQVLMQATELEAFAHSLEDYVRSDVQPGLD